MARTKSAAILESELYTRLAQVTGHGKDVVKDVITGLTEFIIDELKNETPVKIGKMGEIYTTTYKGRGGYDFAKGQAKPNKVITKIKFKPSAPFKRAIESLNENYHED
jgi:nucleoid DNA-binding protein